MGDMPDRDAAVGRQELVALLRQVATGDKAALKHVYDRTQAKLFGVALRILNDRREAEDVLQDVYLSVWMKAADFDPERASPITWLATIARNRSIDRVRQIGRRDEKDIDTALEIADASPDAFEQVSAEDERQRLAACIEELDGRTGEAIRTAFFGGVTYQELADKAEVPLGTMKSVIRRGLIKLKGCLSR
ncbi:sigma-70 family RNA polymerase sigma factor [Fulvimarina sp. 2208YS6-2-32]|uniref:RNA polymerase sigma factor n=1 Tax=Fulvimarina uroteuthidis TaxID=3098149 RepID=A0ABU5I0C9_9HYPH|nr:sigma-70 family RNA polymerase sigma factor [Fulvimarina sp. 2208YS6-2-32]MDY8108582.1 sigma-70 family RNA polymerase sigma factor [Fulvimarina sp. 2208YS6-2-32]